MHERGPRIVVVLLALALAVAALPAVAGAASDGDAPPDPEEDTIGWENGYWYNESVDVTRDDGLNESELDAVVARSMARVEQVRGLEFEKTVPVEVISRETYREQLSDDLDNTSREQTMHSNVVLEAMLTLGESESSKQAQEDTLGSGVLGLYKPSTEEIQIVSENATTPKMNEITLSQELFHALQDQHFGLNMSANTTDGHNAHDGIVEGDGNYVDYRYQQRCESEWSCLMPQEEPGGGGSGGEIHYGLQLTLFQPYSDGPPFVKQLYDEGGWDAVGAVYDDPPESSEQVIHPEKYGTEPPVEVDYEDTSGADWRILEVPNASVNYDTVGEAGMAVMTLYPFFESGREVRRDRVQAFITGGSALDPYNYSYQATAGWGGDRIYPYVRDDSYETNETGYVWKTVWDTERDAAQFEAEYFELLAYYGAAPVDGHVRTFRIPDEQFLGDAFYVDRSGTTVTIVNAPTVDELPNVRGGAAPEGEGDLSGTPWGGQAGTTTTTATPTPSDTPTPADGDDGADGDGTDGTAGDGTDGGGADGAGSDGDGAADTTTTSGSGPGFGPAAAALALAGLAAVSLARRRR